MKHTEKATFARVMLLMVAAGAGLALGSGREIDAQSVLRQPLAQNGTASQLRVQNMQGELLPANTVEAALKSLSDQAAVIFIGSVSEVTETLGGARVAFAVEDGLRGAATGSTYVMNVSSWGGGVERYHAGERALFLLLAPSAQGFSSPVGGELGIVPMSGDAVAGNVDLRWIATMVQRTVATANAPASVTAAAVAATTPTASVAGHSVAGAGKFSQTGVVSGASVKEQLAMSNVTGVDVHAIDRGLVTAMLRAWSTAEGAR